jgi:N-methylhydantoinase A
MPWRIGIDIGGTFTDVALVDEASGRIEVAKIPTTPADFGQAVITGIRQGLTANAIAAADVALLAHATTVVTNALLEKKGARAGFIATRGFRDLLELRRSSRADLYDLLQDAPDVLVPRRWRFEITERIDAQGAVVTPLADAEIPPLIDAIRAAGLQTVAVSFLFSFLNDVHERRVGAALRQALPDVQVYLSSEVLPEIREFERASTTAVCAYVGPLLGAYLDRLQRAASDLGLPKLHVMGSSGGVFDIAEALRMPAMAVESGPAAGVIAAALAGQQLGRPNLISLDMGGTTAKASVIAGAKISVTAEYEVGGGGHANRWMHGTGHPIRVPVIDLAEVSAGGGSIAWVDPGGALKVGPHSAGADPGPAAYGAGGTAPTVTDADVVLGYLDRTALLGGALRIDSAAAERAIAADVGDPLGLTVVEAAARIVEVVNSNMAQALRIVSVERGHDPQEFSLIAFGGAGPVHAAALAAELQIPEVIIPPAPGAFSALGLVASDLKRDFSRTLYADLDSIDPGRIADVLAGMQAEGLRFLDTANVPQPRRALLRLADVRYRRQAYELTVPIADGPITRATLDALATSFHTKHEQTYGHANRTEPVQLVNLRLTALGRLPGLTLTQRSDAAAARQHVREVWFAETGFVTTPVHWRDGLLPDTHIAGPAIIEAMDSTTVIPPAWRAAIDDRGYIRLSRERVESVTSPTLAALSPEVGEGRDDGFVTRRPRSLVPQAPSPQPAPTTGRGE